MSESNVFAMKDGYSVHIKVTLDEEKPLSALLNNTEVLIKWMKENGYTHDTSKDRQFGGRGQKPETPVPDDLKDRIPQHCGEPMVYKIAGNGKGVFECRKGKGCAQPREHNGAKYPASRWEDDVRKAA